MRTAAGLAAVLHEIHERNHLCLDRVEHRALHALQVAGDIEVGVCLGEQRHEIDEVADQRVFAGVCASRHRDADAKAGLPRGACQQGHETREHQRVRRDVMGARGGAQLRGQGGIQRHVERGSRHAPVPGTREIGVQVERKSLIGDDGQSALERFAIHRVVSASRLAFDALLQVRSSSLEFRFF